MDLNTPKTWYDRLPVGVQHALLLLVAALVTAGVSVIPALDIPFPYDLLLGSLATWAGAWATKITVQYGRGSKDVTVLPDAVDESKGH